MRRIIRYLDICMIRFVKNYHLLYSALKMSARKLIFQNRRFCCLFSQSVLLENASRISPAAAGSSTVKFRRSAFRSESFHRSRKSKEKAEPSCRSCYNKTALIHHRETHLFAVLQPHDLRFSGTSERRLPDTLCGDHHRQIAVYDHLSVDPESRISRSFNSTGTVRRSAPVLLHRLPGQVVPGIHSLVKRAAARSQLP